MQDQTRSLGSEELAVGRVQIESMRLHVGKDRSQLFFEPIYRIGAESGLAVPGDSHADDERQQGRAVRQDPCHIKRLRRLAEVQLPPLSDLRVSRPKLRGTRALAAVLVTATAIPCVTL